MTQPFGPRLRDLVSVGGAAGFAFIEEVVLAAGDLADRLLDGGDPGVGVVAVAGVLAA
ncbi:hypothetical protein [Nocardia bovistercoris]|uniref:Uncharacterized protein n=1 Tax=Nocardia bovistercoris TaxID=2785916 RepID=A0A931IC21_9NOCA|nr:hypothetical protein [Nocardia bovistercoris]MBH0777675.1 hypothetical protein [Nocardia bovistercoris]